MSTDNEYICIDFEASGLGPQSYPIEVAVVSTFDWHYSTLIKPTENWRLHGKWCAQAEKIHNISFETLTARGQDPQFVAATIEAFCNEKIVCSDAPSSDGQWLCALFHAAGRPVPFQIQHISEVYEAIAIANRLDDHAIATAAEDAGIMEITVHRAYPDALRLARFLTLLKSREQHWPRIM